MPKVHRPCRLAMNILRLFTAPKLKKQQHLQIDKTEILNLKPPYFVVYNHIGENDHFVVEQTLYPYYANNMVSRWVQFHPTKSFFTSLGGSIYKTRFTADAESILTTKKVFKQFKNIVALAPAGVYSFDGTPHTLEYSTARLFKMFKVPVVALNISGLYFYRNTFMKSNLKSHIKAKATLLFTPEQLKNMQPSEIYKKMYEALDFNDFLYQEKEGFTIQGDNKAEGMEKVLYKCLNCGNEFTMQSQGNNLRCCKCGNEIAVDDTYHFVPISDNCKYVKSIDIWNMIQQQAIYKECKDENYTITDTCEIWHNNKNGKKGYKKYGEGKISLTREGLKFAGVDDGKEAEYSYPIERTTNMGYDLANNHISVERENVVTFYRLSEPRKILKIVQSIILMRKKFYPNFEGEIEWLQTLPSAQRDTTILTKE